MQFDYVEVSAPVYEQWPPASHTRIFINSENSEDERRDGLPPLVPVSVAAADACLEVVLSSGTVLRVPEGTAIQTLRDVLAALEPERC